MKKKVWWYCNICEGEYQQRIDVKCKNSKCSICAGKIVTRANCIATTNPDIHDLMLNKEDGFRYTHKSDARIDWKCNSCDHIITNKQIKNIAIHGLSCPQCSEGMSYPEKIMINLLTSMKVSFIHDEQLSFSMGKRYDFFLPEYNCIIEMHGRQHFEENGFESAGGRTLLAEQENDRIKQELAFKNRIKHYFSIDCRKSDIDWIKHSILQSGMADILDFSSVQWHNVGTATDNRKLNCLNMYNDGRRDYRSMAKELSVDYSTIIRWLKFWDSIGKCHYTATSTNREVVQLTSDNKYIRTWNSVSEARKKYKNVSKVLSGERKMSNGYIFMYIEDYSNLKKER